MGFEPLMLMVPSTSAMTAVTFSSMCSSPWKTCHPVELLFVLWPLSLDDWTQTVNIDGAEVTDSLVFGHLAAKHPDDLGKYLVGNLFDTAFSRDNKARVDVHILLHALEGVGIAADFDEQSNVWQLWINRGGEANAYIFFDAQGFVIEC